MAVEALHEPVAPQLPTGPNYQDAEAILALITDAWDRYKRKRYSFERDWYRNLLFLLGVQWIKWDETSKQWRKRRLLDWVPTPVTNRFASTGERLVAVLSRVEPNWLFVPASDNEQDVAAAEVAEKLEPVIAEENDLSTVRDQTARWLVYTGNAFLFSWAYPKPEETPPPDPAALSDPMAALVPPTPKYCLYTDVYSPFQVYANMTIESLENQECVLLCERKDVSWINKTYGVQLDEEKGDEDPEEVGLHYLEAVGYVASDTGYTEYAYGRDQSIPRLTLKRLIKRPSPEWPEGLYAVTAGEVLLEAMPLPKSVEGKPFIPLVHLKFDHVPGAFFGRTPMNDLVWKQQQRNKLESLIELITMRMASPIWLVPEGTIVKGWNVGEPGSILRYSLVGDKATRPDRLAGEEIPNSLVLWLNKIDQDFEELASTFEVLKGEAPYSGVPGVVVQQLLEQGMNRFGPAFRGLAEGWRKWMKVQIELFRLYADEPRLVRVLGDNAKWKISKFSKADLLGAVDVRIESESTVPRSEMVEAAKVLEAVNLGLVDVLDPDIRRNVIKKLQLPTNLIKTINEQVLDAVKENEAMAMGSAVPVKPFLDDHVIHIAKHKSFALSEEAQMPVQQPMVDPMTGEPVIDPMTGMPAMQTMKVQDLVLQHLAEHNMIMDAENNGFAGPMGPAPGQPPGGGGKPAGPGGGSALAPPADPGKVA